MNGAPLFFLLVLSVSAILAHCVTIASRLSRKAWEGHGLRYLGVSAAYALIAGGSVGAALKWQIGCDMLLVGVALLFLSERRVSAVDRGDQGGF